MIRFHVAIAILSMLALPARATDGAASPPADAVVTERIADQAPNTPVAESQPVTPTTPPASTAPETPSGASDETAPPVPTTAVSPESPSPSRLSSPPDLSPMLFGLLVVLGVMAGILWLMKRMGMVRTGAASIGRVVGAVSLGNRERLVVVEVADQWIVVGVAPGRVNALAQMPRQDRDEAKLETAPAAPNFSDWLKQTIDKRNGSNGNSGSGR